MRRLFVLLLPVFLFSAPKMPLLEMFTSVNCPGCGPADDTLDNLYAQYQGQIAIVRYHIWWVGTDPYYQANPGQNFTRTNFYGIPYSPYLWINGTINGDYTSDQWRGLVVNALQETTSIGIAVSMGVDTSFGTVRIVSTVVNNGQDTISANLMCILVEDSLYYMGSNGHPWHHQVMRKMLPSASGKNIHLSSGGVLQDTEYVALDPSWVPKNLRAVVFLQNLSTKQVYQTGFAEATFVQVEEGSSGRTAQHVRQVLSGDGVRLLGTPNERPAKIRMFAPDGRVVPVHLEPIPNGWRLSPARSQSGLFFYRIEWVSGQVLRGRLVIF